MPGTVNFPAPFTGVDLVYREAFDLYIDHILSGIEQVLAAPMLTCVTLWIVIQGIMVMRGDIDARHGITKIVSVAIVVSLVLSATIYHDYVYEFFHHGIPQFVRDLGGNFGLPPGTLPMQLDVIFRFGEAAFQGVAAQIPPDNELDASSFDMAQLGFYFTLWSIFGIYHVVEIMMSVMVALGPLFIIGFLFDATRSITTNWVGIMVAYAIMLLLVMIVATIVVSVIISAGVYIISQMPGANTSQDIILLYELDFLILTGNALLVAVPTIASTIGGGVTVTGSQMGQSFMRRAATYYRPKESPMGPANQTQWMGNRFQ